MSDLRFRHLLAVSVKLVLELAMLRGQKKSTIVAPIILGFKPPEFSVAKFASGLDCVSKRRTLFSRP